MSSNHEIIKSHFNIQTNPFLLLHQLHKKDKPDKPIDDDKLSEIEEYLDTTSDELYNKDISEEDTSQYTSQYTSPDTSSLIRYIGEMLLSPSKLTLQQGTKVNIVIYRVNHNGMKPFLEFCLYKINHTLNIPQIKWQSNNTPEQLRYKLSTTFKNYTTSVDYKGFYNNENTPYLFYKLEKTDNVILQFSNKNPWMWVTVDEIINQRKTFDLNIDKSVSMFFIHNEYFAYLEDTQGNIIEIPSVAYIGSDYKYINVVLSMGLLKQDAIYGPFYYFNSYDKAYQDAVDNGTKSGIIRFVLFMGNTHVILRNHIDNADSIIQPSKNINIHNIHNKPVYYHPLYVVKQQKQYLPLSFSIIE